MNRRVGRARGKGKSAGKDRTRTPRRSGGAPAAPPDPPFRVIGVGGSAGGIAPCADLLAAIPPGSDLAVIIVMHLSPTHESGLAALFSHATTMPVAEAVEGDALAKGHVYVIPPGSALVVREGALHLEPRSSRRNPPSVVDRLFASLAESYGAQAVGVVLSGTGSDGTEGLRAIKTRGGTTFAQDPETAEHDGMPGGASKQGVVDHVLPPAAIGRALATLSAGGGARPATGVKPRAPARRAATTRVASPAAVDAIIAFLGTTTGVDFAHYKRPTLERRIARRMEHLRSADFDGYLAHLKTDPDEVLNLYREVLIKVTEFFRDPESLVALRRTVLGPLLRGRKAGDPLRIWVAGCATGEEAYSMAIQAIECAAEAGSAAPVQIFATDLSEPALATARAGVYAASIEAKVSAERLGRFFRPVKGGYEVQTWVRADCVFARHDLTRDPPFSRLDLVSCRNVLIYLDAALQERVLRTFHYALNPGGFLMLGPAETTNLTRGLFVLRDRKHKIYAPSGARTELPSLDSLALSALRHRGVLRAGAPGWHPEQRTVAELERVAEQVYRIEYPSARIIVNESLDILHLQGATGQYLEEPAGEPTTRLLNLVRPELRATLGRLLRQAQKGDTRARQAGVPFQGGSRVRAVDLSVLPLAREGSHARYCLVVFEPRPAVRPPRAPPGRVAQRATRHSQARVLELQQELRETRDYLQSVIELQEASQAEVRAAYEESLSSNEEFQSTNEELETTKEELQSMNEEISTLNEELLNRNAELNQSISDLNNILQSIDTPVVLVDRELRIRQFSPRASQVFGLAPADLGRALTEVRWKLAPSGMVDLCLTVLHESGTREEQVEAPDGHGYLFRVSPYRVPDGSVAGAVLALIDVDAMHQLLVLSDVARNYSDTIIETVWQPLLVLDERHRVRRANSAFDRTFDVAPDSAVGCSIYEIMGGVWDFGLFRNLLESGLLPAAVSRELEVTREFPALGERVVRLRVHRMVEPGRKEPSLLLAVEDVTERRRVEKDHLDRAAKAEALGTLAGGVAHDLNNQLTALLGFMELVEAAPAAGEERAGDLAEVRRAAEHMAETIRQLLAFGRRQLLQPASLELNAVVAAEANMLRQVLGPRIQLIVTPSDGALWFQADPVQLENVLLNLAFNARDAMPNGGRLEITTGTVLVDATYARRYGAEGAIPGPHVRLIVSDTGTGMDAGTRARIFEPFFTTKELGHGTGLGLASVYGIVKQSGGWIWVDSAPGTGTSFTIDLPAITAGTAEVAATPAPPRAREVAATGTVLVVDDEEIVRRTVARQLRSLGYQVLEAGSGAGALAQLAQHEGRVDLLLTDVLMEGMNGPELVKQVAGIRPGVPAVFMSGYPRELLVDQGPPLLTNNQLLQKPFSRDELAAMVQAALANPPAGTGP